MAFRYPPFSWSHSRDRMLITCARRYYWHYYGRLDPDPDLARWAWILRNLTSLDLILGTVVHQLAREAALAVKAGRNPPGYDEWLRRARLELNRACLSSHHRDAFVRQPTEIPMLQEVWYTGHRDEHTTQRVREKMLASLSSLAASPVWSDLSHLNPDRVVVVDSLSSFLLDGIPVYAAPDLAYRPNPLEVPASARPGANLVIVDWKTGAHSDDADLQLGVYALGLVLGQGLEFDEPWLGHVALLATDEAEWHEVTALDLARAKQRIRSSIAAMQELQSDCEGNVPLPREAFPLAPPECRSRCPACPFFQLCEEELARSDDRGAEPLSIFAEASS